MRLPRLTSPAAVLGALALLALLAYWRVGACGYVWDDDEHVVHNPVLLHAAGLWRIWFEPTSLPQYYPLVHTSFWLEYRLWGAQALGYHVDNVVLHTLAAWLAWRLATRLALPGAFFAAAWFLVHPVHVESVAWVTERKNVLSLVCALTAAGRWLAWHDGGSRRDAALGGVWFVAALLSKTVTATLPAALLVVLWWRDGAIARRAWRTLLPWLAVGAAMAAFTAWLEATHVGGADVRWQLGTAERLLVAGRAPWFYLASLLWPFGTCFNYARWQLDAVDLASWAWPAATAAAVVAAWALRARLGRGVLAVLLLFGGTLLPVLGFFDVFPFRYAFVADHFQYHASVAVIVGLAATLAVRVPAVARAPLAVLFLAGNVALVWHGIGAYRDAETLWQRTLACNARSSLALTNLGALANLRNDAATAKPLLERAVAIDPGSHEAWNDLGVIAHRAGDTAAARSHYERALQCKPDDASAHHNLAVLLLEQGRARDALPHAEQAIASKPDYIEGRTTLARVLATCELWERALAECDYVLQRVPAHSECRQQAVACLLHLGRFQIAASNAMVWLRSEPASATAREALVAAMAHALRSERAESVRAMAEGALSRSGLDPAPLLPGIAASLRSLGAVAQADALGGR